MGEPGIGYRVWYEGRPVGDLPDDPAALSEWLAARHVEVAELVALPADKGPVLRVAAGYTGPGWRVAIAWHMASACRMARRRSLIGAVTRCDAVAA